MINGRKTIGVIFLLVFSSIMISSTYGLATEINELGDIIYVAVDGTLDYTSIQDAINASNPGDTIYVYNGTYVENIIVNKSITLLGENKELTIIDGSGSGDVVYISANHVNMSYFTIKNNSNVGIYAKACITVNSSNCLISDNIFSSFTYGIIAIGENNAILDNVFSDGESYSILLDGSNYSSVTNNTITNSSKGIVVSLFSDENTISSNVISVTTDAIYCSVDSNSNTIINNVISNNENGISIMAESDNNIISGNNIFNNDEIGIYVYLSSMNTISENYIYNNSKGILIECQSYNNTIYQNEIQLNRNYGIIIESDTPTTTDSNHNTFYYNNFIENVNNSYDPCSNYWNLSTGEGNYWDDFDNASEGAYDNNSDGIVDSPYNLTGGDNQDNYPLIEAYGTNHAPDTPDAPVGPITGLVGDSLNYEFSAVDSDGDDMWLLVNWGFGVGWMYHGPYQSGETVVISHTYYIAGIYDISVMAKDSNGAYSNDWSDSLQVNISASEEPQLNLTIAPLVISFGKIAVMFKNIGNQDLINVKWEIYVTKGIILKREILNTTGRVNVTTELPAYVTTGFSSLKHKFGLVNVSVVATVDGHIFTESTRGLVVGRLFIKF